MLCFVLLCYDNYSSSDFRSLSVCGSFPSNVSSSCNSDAEIDCSSFNISDSLGSFLFFGRFSVVPLAPSTGFLFFLLLARVCFSIVF